VIRAFQLGAFQENAFQIGEVIQADFGGHFGVTKRRRRLPKNDRTEIRELLDEVLATPAAPEIEEILDAAVPVNVPQWSAPPMAALDALMGQAALIQRILVLAWQSEAEAKRQREEEEQMLLLMML
jgi:hypothetical protein